MITGKKLSRIYRILYSRFGPQRWWPADSPFEVIIGSILTQNTAWGNVEKAIANLKRARYLSAKAMRRAGKRKLASLIRPAGYYNIKAERLLHFLDYLARRYRDDLAAMFSTPWPKLRKELLSVKGIGPETADSILLYAGGKPVFVVDAYTKRVLTRHGLIGEDSTYDYVQRIFTECLPKSSRVFNEYHALIVALGKTYCRRRPECDACPIKGL